MSLPDIVEFFDGIAETWEENLVRDDEVIDQILNRAGVGSGERVLDVACGTGILAPYLLARGVTEVIGVDVAPRMIEIAKSKFADPRVRFVCADVLAVDLPGRFDRVVVYNSFPHFPEPGRAVTALTTRLVPGGTLTVAHGLSRAALNAHHHSHARPVSIPLLADDELAQLFQAAGLTVTAQVSDDRMYQVTGRK